MKNALSGLFIAGLALASIGVTTPVFAQMKAASAERVAVKHEVPNSAKLQADAKADFAHAYPNRLGDVIPTVTLVNQELKKNGMDREVVSTLKGKVRAVPAGGISIYPVLVRNAHGNAPSTFSIGTIYMRKNPGNTNKPYSTVLIETGSTNSEVAMADFEDVVFDMKIAKSKHKTASGGWRTSIRVDSYADKIEMTSRDPVVY